MFCASSSSNPCSPFMSPNVSTTSNPATSPINATSGWVKILHRTRSSTGSHPFTGVPFTVSTTFNPTVRVTTCVLTSNASPSRPHSTSTRLSSNARSHASPVGSDEEGCLPIRSDVGVEFKGVRSGVERRRGVSGLKD
eukprot:30445-Pelagococcus_subviridis.AAC.8